ncbi:tRNA pseudouridine(38-40) synthase TruA [Haloarcula hispanica]|uniref:tRNA pseudouridine synthase A n=1 Tax=Haloarcula hispanica TaxID=51589 RepID=A0A482T9Z8_HALHI|nr:tRNA pseudouridine(38-40) synthase TruA [Haloarcula hispanica]MCJ0620812.1 tRNA pseudouridine(38-40) synthase TruA [Haloarcula hispanica]RYJ11172.1 tRNA pseudouridine(38-40) synthase TruA [Haloarcula hispanica]
MRAYRVAYDGRPYHGFQRQPDVDTVEGRLRSALVRLGVCERGDGLPECYAAAGRTDAGVSARAQTVAFDAPAWLSPAAFNGELPDDIRVWASVDVSEGFHATHDATERTYTYYLYAPTDADRLGRASVNDERWGEAVDALAGSHDFHNLTSDDTGTERTVDIDWAREGRFLVVRLTAGGFCRQLVRRLVSLAAAVADGSAQLSKVDRVLSPESASGPDGVPPAPPEPLVLTDVRYPNVTFSRDEDAAADARAVFEHRRANAHTTARVADHITDGL